MSFESLDRTARVLADLHKVRGVGMGMLRGWRTWEITSRTTIPARPQQAVRFRRLMIPGQYAADWVIHDISIVSNNGQRVSQLGAGGGIPGDAFAVGGGAGGYDADMDLGAVAGETDIHVTVEYVGRLPEGAPFYGAMLCEAADGRGGRMTIPLSSSGNIFSDEETRKLGSGKRVALQIDDRAWLFRQHRTNAPFEVFIEETELRCETPTIEELLYVDDDSGHGTTTRVGDPKPVGPEGVRRPARVAFKPPPPRGPLVDGVPDLWAVRPHVLSLHVLDRPHHVLFGLDEISNQVVFEISLDSYDGRNGSLFGRFNRSGYTPTWWGRTDAPALAALDAT